MKTKLSDLYVLQMGKTPSRNVPEFWQDGTFQWASVADLGEEGKYLTKTRERITEVAVIQSKMKKVPADTVIMSFKLSLGKVAITSRPVFTNEAIMAFIPKDEQAPIAEYLFYQLQCHDWEKESANRAVMGTTLNKASLSKVEILVPPKREQRAVVARISLLDAQISNCKTILNKLSELVKSRFIEMFGNPLYSADTMPLSEVGYIGTGSTPSTKEAAYYSPEGLPFIKPGDLPEDSISLICDSETHLSDKGGDVARVFPVGTVLVTCIGTIGKVGISSRKGACNQQINYVIPYDDVDCVYLAYCLLMCKTKLFEMANAPVVPIVNKTQFSSLKIPVPNLALQREFSVFVAQVDKLRFDVQQQIEKLETLKKSLMQEYFG